MMFKVYCPHCKRYLFETDATAIISNFKCAGCKRRINIKVVTPDSTEEELHYKFNKDDKEEAETE